MKKRAGLALILALALLLLSGCAPERKPQGDRAEFDGFLAELNRARGENLNWSMNDRGLVAAASANRLDETGALTEDEVLSLLTRREGVPVSGTEAAEDAALLFRALRDSYGGYEYFGGDEVFFPVRDQLMDRLGRRETLSPGELEEELYQSLSAVIRDNHFRIGRQGLAQRDALTVYYVPELCFDDPAGLDPAYVKPTIGPDGGLTYCFAALSRDGGDLPDSIELAGEETPLVWTRQEEAPLEKTESELPCLVCRSLDDRGGEQEGLERLVETGPEYRAFPVFAVDLRGNSGGNDSYARWWVEGLTGETVPDKTIGAHKYSPLYVRDLEQYGRQIPAELLGRWEVYMRNGGLLPNDSVIFVLMDQGTASAGEDFVCYLRTLENVVFVGSNTYGCQIFGNVFPIWLPHSGARIQMGASFFFHNRAENTEGVGLLPDLWVNPADAMDAVERLCDYYSLRE